VEASFGEGLPLHWFTAPQPGDSQSIVINREIIEIAMIAVFANFLNGERIFTDAEGHRHE
jgi:hypothetical protein